MKIASGYWKGLEVSLVDEAKVALPEYPPEDAEPKDDRVSKHLECRNDQRFSLKINRPVPSVPDSIRFTVVVDGRQIDRFVMDKECSWCEIDSYNERGPDGAASKYLKFGLPDLSDDAPRLDPSLIDQLGIIKITLEAGTSFRTGEVRDSYTADSSALGIKAKKVLGSFVTSEHRGAATTRETSQFTGDAAVPNFVMSFIYRPRGVLEMLGVVPAAVEPEVNTVEAKPAVLSGSKRKVASDEKSTKKKRKRSKGSTRTASTSKSISPGDADDEPEVIDLTGQ